MSEATVRVALILAAYIAASRMVLRNLRGGTRDFLMAILNLSSVYGLFFLDKSSPSRVSTSFVIYLVIVLAPYCVLRCSPKRAGWVGWAAFFLPIASLVLMRYVPDGAIRAAAGLVGKSVPRIPVLIGLSYMAFRCSRLVLEVRNGGVPMPGLWRYLAFAFFLPTLSVGPISPFADFNRAFGAPLPDMPPGRACLRILVGFVKYVFFGALLGQLDYAGFLRNGHLHLWVHLPVAMIAYYLYLYCNFSGFCDMAIGASALIGIPVAENFDRPFAARNIKDFWNRWHITLSHYMRDIVFAPLSKSLVRLMGPSNANHAIAIAVAVVFLLVGVWHGVGWNYAAYGLTHAAGLVVNHYYTINLKRWLGRDLFHAYSESRVIHMAAVALTFSYCAATLMLFANTPEELYAICSKLRWTK